LQRNTTHHGFRDGYSSLSKIAWVRPGSLAGQDLPARTARQLEQILDHEIEPPLGWWLLDHDAGTVLQGSRHVARPKPAGRCRGEIRRMTGHQHDLARFASQQRCGTDPRGPRVSGATWDRELRPCALRKPFRFRRRTRIISQISRIGGRSDEPADGLLSLATMELQDRIGARSRVGRDGGEGGVRPEVALLHNGALALISGWRMPTNGPQVQFDFATAPSWVLASCQGRCADRGSD
jgi:hypothetical protein